MRRPAAVSGESRPFPHSPDGFPPARTLWKTSSIFRTPNSQFHF